jgi:DNA-directed RNA polymerase subunit M/transcription elongation factor TFIIS
MKSSTKQTEIHCPAEGYKKLSYNDEPIYRKDETETVTDCLITKILFKIETKKKLQI